MDRLDIEKTLRLLKIGDVSALQTIYVQNRDPFLMFAKKYDLPEEDLIDIYQDAIIALRDNVVNGKLKQLESSISTYLFSIGKYMIYKKTKSYKTNNVFTEDFIEQNQIIDQFEFYEENQNINQQLINKNFEKLGEKCQQVLRLFYYEGLTLEEIQHHFNYDNYNVVKSQKSRCLRTLKELIKEQKQNG